MLYHNGVRRTAAKWWRACTQLVEHDTERVDITLLVAWMPLHLFWRDVERSTQRYPGRGEGGRPRYLDYPEVGQNRFPHGIVHRIARIKQNIGGLNIAMDDAMLVSIVD